LIALVLLLAAADPHAEGLRLLRDGHAEEALALLEEAARKEPRNGAVAADYATALARAGRRADAEAALRDSIARDPRRSAAYATLAALVAEDEDRWERASEVLALLDRALALVRGEVPRFSVLFAKADLLRAVGRTTEARAIADGLAAVPLPAVQARRLVELSDRIAAVERARAGEDWPEPPVADAQREELARADEALRRGDDRGALEIATRLCGALPGWRAARWTRARALEDLGRVDEAARELQVLVQLAPSSAQAWRKLGELLAGHGGLLEAERADEALREALAREPAWTPLWLLRARVALRLGKGSEALRDLDRAAGSADPAELSHLVAAARALPENAAAPAQPAQLAEPTLQARALLRQAEDALATPEGASLAQALVAQALEDSPAFPEAAALAFALTGEVPARTTQALWTDANALLDLAAQAQRARPEQARAAAPRWIDRAVELGAPEARYQRALLRIEGGDGRGALDDLVAYAAVVPPPAHLDGARALRARLVAPARINLAELQARARLAEDRPEAALAALGGDCDGRPARLAVAVGEVREYSGDAAAAIACYRAALRTDPASAAGLRLSRAAARLEPAKLGELRADLERLADAGVTAAQWPLAREALSRAADDEAIARIDAFLRHAAADDPALQEARSARDRLLGARTDAERGKLRLRAGAASAGAALLTLLVFFLLRGTSVSRALARRPRLYPAVARTVASLRHDVLKHRASVLSAASDPTVREQVARALLSPEPASEAVARAYERLREAARSNGVVLRPLGREPVFGPLVRDLGAAEAILRGERSPDALAEIDRRLREVHGPALAALLREGPTTTLDARALSDWIHGVEAEVRRGGTAWTPPSILLQGVAVEFPVERDALATIFANLLRNAQAAAGEGGRVLVRMGEERDAAGRRVHVLFVGDSAASDLTAEAIERRESGRGLAIVRDLTREWAGHVVVRREEPPLRKAVGACFPAPAGAG
jgi:Tetratricopeptide repeat